MNKLTVITGPMFSGKSTELVRLYRENERTTLCFKPTIDKRYSGVTYIDTHDGMSIPVTPVGHPKQIKSKMSPFVDTVIIDEVQFFPMQEMVEVIDDLIFCGINVIVAGLNYNFRGEPFATIETLQKQADYVRHMTGECGCGENYTEFTIRHGDYDQTKEVLIGGKDAYSPVCGPCFRQHQQGNRVDLVMHG